MALQNENVDFEAYLATVEAGEKASNQQQATAKGFKVPDCVEVGDKAIVRFINGIAETAMDQGKPGSGRAKLFNIGWIRDDNNKSFLLCLPAIINNVPMYQSTMCEFIDKVLSRTWVKAEEGSVGATGSWKYFYEDRADYGQQMSGDMTLKDIFWKVFKSGAEPSNPMYKAARTWRGQTIYVANVIDRRDYTWHKAHKTTKLLMRKVNISENRVNRKEVSFYAIGAPLKELSANHGFGLNYDVLIVPGSEPTSKFKMYNISKLKEKEYWDDVNGILTEADKACVSIDRGFTEEEATWNTLDISEYYKFTSAKAILKHLGKTIKAFDMMVGTNFYGKFEEDAKHESANEPVKEEEVKPVAAPVVETPAQPQVTAPQPVASPNFDKFEANGAPAEVPVSASAKQSIDDFYSTLD